MLRREQRNILYLRMNIGRCPGMKDETRYLRRMNGLSERRKERK
jgi:hypothetical protein